MHSNLGLSNVQASNESHYGKLITEDQEISFAKIIRGCRNQRNVNGQNIFLPRKIEQVRCNIIEVTH